MNRPARAPRTRRQPPAGRSLFGSARPAAGLPALLASLAAATPAAATPLTDRGIPGLSLQPQAQPQTQLRSQPDAPRTNFLMIDQAEPTTVRVVWTTEGGSRVSYEADRRFLSPTDHTPLGGNLSCFVALGGKRLEKGAGHPSGAIVRIGFYKIDKDAPLFAHIDPTSSVTITLEGIRFDRPVDVFPETGIHHSMYDHAKVMAYGLPMKAMDTHNLVSRTDTLNDRVSFGEDTRPGALAPDPSLDRGITITEQPDGSYTLVAQIPYPLFRHIKDDGTLPEPMEMDHATMMKMMQEQADDLPRSDERPRSMKDGMQQDGMQMDSTRHGNMKQEGAHKDPMKSDGMQPEKVTEPGLRTHVMPGMKPADDHSETIGPDGLPMTDPTMPGGFFEPYHFHIEFEAVPKNAPPHIRERAVQPSEQ